MVYRTLRTVVLACILVSVVLASCSKKEQGLAKITPTEKKDAAVSSSSANTVPRIVKLELKPLTPRSGDELIVEFEADGDAAAPVDFRFEWSVNDERIYTEIGQRFRFPFKKKDRINVMITPELGGVKGLSLSQTAVIGNSPPVVHAELVDVMVSKSTYSCRVRAEDPDGDALTFKLLKGPKGMTIDQKTGVITGEYQQPESGFFTLSVSVKDTDAAEVVLDVPFQLGFEK